MHPYAQTLIAEPLPDTAAMAPAGQVWSTVADLATYCRLPARGPRRRAERRGARARLHPAVGGGARRPGLLARAGLPDLPRRLGHARRPQRLDARVPRHLPGRPHAPYRRRRPGQRHLRRAGRGLRGRRSSRSSSSGSRRMPVAWAPNETVPAEFADVLGLWHWGATADRLRVRGRRPRGPQPRRRDLAVRCRRRAGRRDPRLPLRRAAPRRTAKRRRRLAPRRRHVHPDARALRGRDRPIPGGRPRLDLAATAGRPRSLGLARRSTC